MTNRDVLAILSSAAYNSVHFDRTAGCWKYRDPHDPEAPELLLRGVSCTLRARCWSKYNYHAAERATTIPAACRVPTGVRSARQGKNRGSAVHEQLHAIAALGFPAAQRMFVAERVHIQPIVTKLLDDFLARQWRLVCSELPVFDERPAMRYGSAIDLVCEHKATGKLMLLELKTGGDNYRHNWNARMERELQPYAIMNTPTNQAKVQLLAYKALFERCYPAQAVNVVSFAVVFVSEASPKPVYELLTDDDIKLQPYVMAALAGATADHAAPKRAAKRRK